MSPVNGFICCPWSPGQLTKYCLSPATRVLFGLLDSKRSWADAGWRMDQCVTALAHTWPTIGLSLRPQLLVQVFWGYKFMQISTHPLEHTPPCAAIGQSRTRLRKQPLCDLDTCLWEFCGDVTATRGGGCPHNISAYVCHIEPDRTGCVQYTLETKTDMLWPPYPVILWNMWG